jgi:hypothetical protein
MVIATFCLDGELHWTIGKQIKEPKIGLAIDGKDMDVLGWPPDSNKTWRSCPSAPSASRLSSQISAAWALNYVFPTLGLKSQPIDTIQVRILSPVDL